MNMKVGLGQAEGFLYFDEKTQTLKINENSLNNSKAGVYAVTVTVWLNDESNPSSITESYSEDFYLTVP